MRRLSITFAVLWFVLAASLNANCACDSPGPVPFESNDHKWGYLTNEGIVIPPRFDLAAPFTKDGAIACIAGRCGLIDKSGVFVSALIDAGRAPVALVEGLGPVVKPDPAGGPLKDKWGYADQSGKVVIPFQFSFAHAFDKGTALVGRNGKAFFINHSGDRVTPEFDGGFDFSEDLAAVIVDGKVGYIRRDGSFALPPIYQSASGISFSEGLVAVRINGRAGFMNSSGTVVIAPAYDDIYPFSEGLAPVELGGKMGYIDVTGKVVIPLRYHIGHMFSEGVASVQLGGPHGDGKWGYIDHAGTFVVAPTFDSAMPFCGGVASVKTFRAFRAQVGRRCIGTTLKGKSGFIDHTGRYVWRDADEREWCRR